MSHGNLMSLQNQQMMKKNGIRGVSRVAAEPFVAGAHLQQHHFSSGTLMLDSKNKKKNRYQREQQRHQQFPLKGSWPTEEEQESEKEEDEEEEEAALPPTPDYDSGELPSKVNACMQTKTMREGKSKSEHRLSFKIYTPSSFLPLS